MNLQFTNKGGTFVSEFEVTSDFNLHIEGVRLSDMRIGQKTAGGSYAEVTEFPSERSQDRVADFDFASIVYPKFIKVICATEPTYAEIATNGEVTEIKSQSKEVEITANGVTEIAPDNGFGYLSGVKVNVNVPQSGTSGDAPSQPSGGINMKYIDIRAMDELDAAQVAMFAYCVAGLTEDNTFVAITLPFEMLMPIDTNKRFAISIPWDTYVYMQGTKMLVGPTIEAQFGSKLKYLTEEEFYNPATYA